MPLTPPEREALVGGGAGKNFPALLDLHRRFPKHKWIFFTDDDTFVFVRNLMFTLGNYNHDSEYYIGLYWTPRVDMEWKEVQIAYASGGAGYALSRRLLSKLSVTMDGCHRNYTRWAGDIRVGKCIADLGVRITPEIGFHHEGHDKYVWDSSGGGFPYGHLSNTASAAFAAPVTFHHLPVDHLSFYHRMSLAEVRGPHGQLYRWDFSPFMFKEYMAYSSELEHSFRILFGSSVEVARRALVSPRQSMPWRRDFSDPLYVRHVVEEGGLEVFHMNMAKVPEIFNGDGCLASTSDPWRLPLRKSALLRIQCQPCTRLGAPAGEAPGFGHMCRVYREDACTLKINLALECPPRQTVFAQSLDVGTVPRGDAPPDIVYMGRPLACGAPRPLPLLVEGAVGGAVGASAGAPRLFHLSLTHDDLEIAAPLFHVQPPVCSARALGKGVTATGGLMHATRPQVLRVICTCPGGPRLANVTVTLPLLEYTSPTWSYMHECAAADSSEEAEAGAAAGAAAQAAAAEAAEAADGRAEEEGRAWA